MPVGVMALASAIARPRRLTRLIASCGVRTPVAAAAVISPTECPATTPAEEASVSGLSAYRASRASSPAPTMSGWATAVSRIVSASDVVPWVTRSTPAASDSASARSRSPGSSSQAARNPGVWEP